MCGENQALLITCPIQSQQWSMVVAASCCGGVFQLQGQDDWLQSRERWMRPSTGISWTKPSPECSGPQTGPRFTFQQDNDPKHTAKYEGVASQQLRTVLEWPSQSPDLNPIEHLWRDLKMAVHQRLPSNLTELERICKEEWQRIPKSRCEKLVASFPKRLMAVLNQKGASTKYWAKGLNT